MVTLIHHGAQNEERLPFSSLAGLERCLEDGAAVVEVDIIPLADGDFALLHDVELERASDGYGLVYEQNAETIRSYHYLDHEGKPSGYPLGTLSEAVRLMEKKGGNTRLQLDLKPYSPLSAPVLEALHALIEPIRSQVLISSVADWAIRSLRQMDDNLALGFDPLLYLDIESETPRPEGVPPLRVGAYGYRDEHPLSIQRWGNAGAYFFARAEALAWQVPPALTWFINARLLDDAKNAGFEWVRYLHQLGHRVDAWTLDLDELDLANQLITDGVDFVTTNQAKAMAAAIGHQVQL